MPRRGTKRDRHLAHLRETGQMTPWLERRLAWDDKLKKELLDEMFNQQPKSPIQGFIDLHKYFLAPAIKEQFEKQAAFYKMYVGEEKADGRAGQSA